MARFLKLNNAYFGEVGLQLFFLISINILEGASPISVLEIEQLGSAKEKKSF